MNIVSSLFNLNGPDTLIILLVVLLLFGAKRLPELARGLGQAMNEFTKAKDDMERQIHRAGEPAVVRPAELQEHTAQPASATVAATAEHPEAVEQASASSPEAATAAAAPAPALEKPQV